MAYKKWKSFEHWEFSRLRYLAFKFLAFSQWQAKNENHSTLKVFHITVLGFYVVFYLSATSDLHIGFSWWSTGRFSLTPAARWATGWQWRQQEGGFLLRAKTESWSKSCCGETQWNYIRCVDLSLCVLKYGFRECVVLKYGFWKECPK